ncbi:acyl-[acyl-carrier-protein]--UDP-N-acetylglucosamine O-acyltransferase, partial [Arthrospira platensis SPKY1]|nr:acyl-[acyl-carrier-protein]--UDP-N-acetylglucosamine O-acyltransferase [Arthrospira platensis SPKY1]
MGPHAVLRSGTRIGAHCLIDAHAIIGGPPQDVRFDPAIRSFVILGDKVTVREGVTVHRATSEGAATHIGEGVFLMAYAHVGHDCTVGDHAIVANNVMLAGNVQIGERTFVGGGAAFHQFVRVGESVMVSGMSRVSR